MKIRRQILEHGLVIFDEIIETSNEYTGLRRTLTEAAIEYRPSRIKRRENWAVYEIGIRTYRTMKSRYFG